MSLLILGATAYAQLSGATGAFQLQQQQQQPLIQDREPNTNQTIKHIHFFEDGTGWIEFNWVELTNMSDYTGSELVHFKHNMTVDNGYGITPLPQECLNLEHRIISKVYYPWGERVNPNTLNLSKVITEITIVPPNLVLPDEIKISPDTIVSMDGAGQILRPEEDESYYKACGYASSAQEHEILNRLK